MDSKTELFLEYKNLLFSMAYNMLGKIDAAEDLVQDAYLRWMEIDTTTIQHAKAFLVKVVTNSCINYMNSARAKKEQYIGVWLPEPMQFRDQDKTVERLESYHAVSIGLLVLLEKLTPQERAVFLLREIFTYDYDELAPIFELSADNCRQLLKRAKTHLGKDTKRFLVDMTIHEKMLQNFLAAVQAGDMDALIGLLKEDIRLYADNGGSAISAKGQRIPIVLKPIEGAENVSKLIFSSAPKFQAIYGDAFRELTLVSGLPSIVTYAEGRVVSIFSIEPEGEKISNIYIQANPEKLKHFSGLV